MDEQELENGLALLLEDMADEPEDGHAIFQRLTQILNGMRAQGMPVPDDLAELEARLGEQFTAEGQGSGPNPA